LFLITCDVFRVHYEVSVPAAKYVRSLYGDSEAGPSSGAVKHNDNYTWPTHLLLNIQDSAFFTKSIFMRSLLF